MTVASVLTVLTLAPAPAGLAQSAGDRQYADPLVTGDGQSGQQSPSSPGDGPSGGDTPTSSPSAPAPTSAPDTATSVAGETASAPQGTLPHTGAEPLGLAAIGLALTACGALALATARRCRHARR